MPISLNLICGPTAIGKTNLALSLAKDHPTSIITIDSRHVYQELPILTGWDLPDEVSVHNSPLTFRQSPVTFYQKDNLRFWGFGFLTGKDKFSAGDFIDLINQIIKLETEKNRKTILVGGSGFYLHSLLYPTQLSSFSSDHSFQSHLLEMTVPELQELLKLKNPSRFSQLNSSDLMNRRRLARAIELAELGEVKQPGPLVSPFKFQLIGLRSTDLAVYRQKIEDRVIQRLENEAIEEVASLYKNYSDISLPIFTTIGVQLIHQFLNGQITRDALIQLWTTKEYQYAKRQLTWFKKEPSLIWYDQVKLPLNLI